MIDGIEMAMMSLANGLTRLASWQGAKDDRVGAIAELAQGFEHLLKWTFILVAHQATGAVPNQSDLKGFSHHPLRALDALLEQAPNDSIILEDREFLSRDADFREMLAIFGQHGAGGRYSALDGLIDDEIKETPLMRLEAHESSIHGRHPHLFELQKNGELRQWFDEWYPILARSQITTLQFGLRSISRMWTIGPASDEGKRVSSLLGRFLFRKDRDLGEIEV